MQWSLEQENIFSAYEDMSDNLQVNAAPGSGKTTVQCEIWNRSFIGNTLYLAFNKPIVEEMCLRTQPRHGSKISTFNSLGHSICINTWPGLKLNKYKIEKHVKALVEHKLPTRSKEKDKYELVKLVRYLKNIPHEVSSVDVQDTIDFYDIDMYPDMIEHALKVLLANINDMKEIDFSDQLLFPVLYGLYAPLYDTVLIDEAQDVNAVQIELLKLLQARNPSVRLCSVGDSHQAIYAFRGSLSDSMADLSREFEALNYPLTITRRCDRKIVELAQSLYPHDITVSPTAQEGRVEYVDHKQYHIRPVYRDYTDIIPTLSLGVDMNNTLIVCRTTAPLVNFAYQLLRSNIPCYIRGRDIGESLIKYIEKSNTEYVVDFLDYMNGDIGDSIVKAVIEKKEERVQSLEDKRDMLSLFCENTKSMYTRDVCLYISNLFKEGKGVQLSTVHKSKGLEASRVVILARDLMPHPLARKDWELVQERNIEYVALTRAQHVLTIL